MMQDSGPRDSGLQDYGLQDSGLQDSGPRDSGLRYSGPRVSGLQDSGPRVSGVRVSGLQDYGLQDSGLQDSGPRDSGPRVSGLQDSGPRVSGVRVSGLQDSGLQDYGLQDSGPRDSGVRVCGVRALLALHWRRTSTYWSAFFSFGLCAAFLGPTLPELRCQSRSSPLQSTGVLFSQQLFLLLGSAGAGLLRDSLLSALSALFSCTLIISLVFAVIPLCHHVVLLSVAMAIAGNAMGVIDTIANRELVKLYRKDSAVFLQALHFFIGLGALVSPLVAEPFLAEDSCVLGPEQSANASLFPLALEDLNSSLAGPGAAPHNISQHALHTRGLLTTRVAYAFWIMALINLPVPAAVLALMYHERLMPCCPRGPPLLDRDSRPSPRPAGGGCQGHESVLACCNPAGLQGHPATFFILQALAGAILFLTDGIIGSYAGFVYTYAVSPPLLMGHKMAACLDSIFWASITAGRLAFIYLSYRYPAPWLIAASLVGVTLVHCLLMVFSGSFVFLFLGTCVLGLCISSVFPTMLTFTEDALNYQGCTTTVLVTSASAGEMLLQLLVGTVIYSEGSYSFLLCCTISSFTALVLFLLLLNIQRVHRHSGSTPDTELKEKTRLETLAAPRGPSSP